MPRMKTKRHDILIHLVLITLVALTLLPFFFVMNNSLRTNSELNRTFFGIPKSLTQAVAFTWFKVTGQPNRIQLRIEPADPADMRRIVDIQPQKLAYSAAMAELWRESTQGYRYSWGVLRPYMVNSFIVSIASMIGVVLVGSITAYAFSRYRFPGHRVLFFAIISFMMIPGILTLVPSFLWMKTLGLLNTRWVLILPYIAGGQVIAIFLFKSFFDALPQELFESARLDGASHFRQYVHIVLPLSKQVMAVVIVMNLLGTWNGFLWPFIVNNDSSYYVVAQGLYMMSQQQQVIANQSTMFAAYVLASTPLLLLFVYATKPFMAGVTSGAFKA
ncbi:MAG TPA: carbohydrate ABC transporter permease [Tepidisphaeraceae bacterium]